jgi:hypothetical protein
VHGAAVSNVIPLLAHLKHSTQELSRVRIQLHSQYLSVKLSFRPGVSIGADKVDGFDHVCELGSKRVLTSNGLDVDVWSENRIEVRLDLCLEVDLLDEILSVCLESVGVDDSMHVRQDPEMKHAPDVQFVDAARSANQFLIKESAHPSLVCSPVLKQVSQDGAGEQHVVSVREREKIPVSSLEAPVKALNQLLTLIK